LINASISKNPDLLSYRYIEKLSPQVKVMFLPSNSPFIFPLPKDLLVDDTAAQTGLLTTTTTITSTAALTTTP
jgi:hypothetical protein